MAMTANERQLLLAYVMRRAADLMGQMPWTKPELLATITNTDLWIDAAAGTAAPPMGYDAALPAAFRNTATGQQKSVLFAWVLMARAGMLTEA